MSEEEQSQSEKGDTKPKPQQLQIPQAVSSPWLFMLSFAVLGFVVGYFVGQSESPIVVTLMPLLFGLIGTGSLFLAQSDKKKRPVLETQAIAASVALFAITCLFGSMYGASLRIGLPLSNYIPSLTNRHETSVRSQLAALPPDQATRYIVLRARLRMIGSSEQEIDDVLTSVIRGDRSRDEEQVRTIDVSLQRFKIVRDGLIKIRDIDSNLRSSDELLYNSLQKSIDQSVFVEDNMRRLSQDLAKGEKVDVLRIQEGSHPYDEELSGLLDLRKTEFLNLAKRAGVEWKDFDELDAALHRLYMLSLQDPLRDINKDLDSVIEQMKSHTDAQPEPRRPHIKP